MHLILYWVVWVILILRYYLYKCRCFGDKPSSNGGLKYLKYCINIEKTTINFLSSTQKEYICKKWLPFEIVLGVWNFSVMLQNVCFNKLNVFHLCKLYMYVICFCICICLCFSLKINKLQKSKCTMKYNYKITVYMSHLSYKTHMNNIFFFFFPSGEYSILSVDSPRTSLLYS